MSDLFSFDNLYRLPRWLRSRPTVLRYWGLARLCGAYFKLKQENRELKRERS